VSKEGGTTHTKQLRWSAALAAALFAVSAGSARAADRMPVPTNTLLFPVARRCGSLPAIAWTTLRTAPTRLARIWVPACVRSGKIPYTY